MKKALLMCCVAFMLLSGCSVLDRGKVISKVYKEPYTTYKVVYDEEGESRDSSRHSAVYEIKVEGLFEGDMIVETRTLSKEEFDSLDVGEEVVFDDKGKVIIE